MADDSDRPAGGGHQEGTAKQSDGRVVVNIEQAVIDPVNAQEYPAKKHHDWYDEAHLVILGLTFIAAVLAAVFTGWLAIRTNHIAYDSEKSLDASTRAYIAVTGVKWGGTPEAGKNQRLKILFRNVGKEAASDFSLIAFVSEAFNFEPDSKGMPYIDPKLVQWPYVKSCEAWLPKATEVVGQRPVYPDVPNEVTTYAFNTGPDFLPRRIIEGTASFWVAGCAVYRSLDKPRQSPFCFFYQPARGEDVMHGTFEWCPVGTGNAR